MAKRIDYWIGTSYSSNNSKSDSYSDRIKKLGLAVKRARKFDVARDNVIYGRNLLRQMAVKDYDYFLSLEQDVIPPKDVIERLLKRKKEMERIPMSLPSGLRACGRSPARPQGAPLQS